MRSILLFLLFFFIEKAASADISKLPAGDQKALREVSRFHEVFIASTIPHDISELWKYKNVRVESSGTNAIPTAITNLDSLPHKLIWVATDGGYYVFHYEIGGSVHSFHILVVKLKHGEEPRLDHASFVWRATGERLKDFPAFLGALAGNKLDDKWRSFSIHLQEGFYQKKQVVILVDGQEIYRGVPVTNPTIGVAAGTFYQITASSPIVTFAMPPTGITLSNKFDLNAGEEIGFYLGTNGQVHFGQAAQYWYD